MTPGEPGPLRRMRTLKFARGGGIPRMVNRAHARSHTLPVRAVHNSQRAFSARGRRPTTVDARDWRAVDLGRGFRRVGGVGHVVGFVHIVE